MGNFIQKAQRLWAQKIQNRRYIQQYEAHGTNAFFKLITRSVISVDVNIFFKVSVLSPES